MSRVKFALAALVVVLVVGAMASSSAMAAGEGWLIKGTLLSGAAQLATTDFVDEHVIITFSGTTIQCTSNTLGGVGPKIESPNMHSATSLVFKECAVTSGGECNLSSGTTIGSLPILSEVTLDGPLAIRGVVKPQIANTLATFQLEGANCAVEGKQPLTGDFEWLAPEGQDERTWQLFSVHVIESSKLLKVGGLGALLKLSILLKLASSLPWSFM